MSSDEEILKNLSFPIKSFRLFALEECIRIGYSGDLLRALRQRLEVEDDEECKAMLGLAVSTVEERAKSASLANVSAALGDFEEVWKAWDVDQKLRWLQTLDPVRRAELHSKTYWIVRNESEPEVLKTWLSTFRSDIPLENLGVLEALLRSSNDWICLTVLEILVARSPHLLGRHFHHLLLSDKVRIRVMSLKGMLAIDPREAVRHLEWMMMGENPVEAIGALNACLMLPMKMVRDLILKVLKVRSEPALLERAGVFFEINPDPHAPFYLFELSRQSETNKARLIRPILDKALKAVRDSGVLGDQFATYRKRLKAWVTYRVAKCTVSRIIFRFLQDPAEGTPEATALLQNHLKNPMIRKICLEADGWNIPQSAKNWLKTFLASDDKMKPIKPTPAFQDFSAMSDEEKIRFLASWKPENQSAGSRFLRDLLISKENSEDVRAMSLRTALRLEIVTFQEQALALLQHNSEILRVSALEYCSRFCPEQMLPVLGPFLKSPRIRVKAKAINALAKFDLPQAVSMLMNLLRNAGPSERSAAMNCVIQFDFLLIRDQLTDFLSRPSGRHLLTTCLFLYSSNPEPENIYCLFRIGKALGAGFSETIDVTRKELGKILIEIGRLSQEELQEIENGLEEKWLHEFGSGSEANPDYSVTSLHPESAGYFGKPDLSLLERFRQEGFPWRDAAVIFFVLGLPVLLFFVAYDTEPPAVYHDPSTFTAFDWSSGTGNSGSQADVSAPFRARPRATIQEELEEMEKLVQQSGDRPLPSFFGGPEMQMMARATMNRDVVRGFAFMDTGDYPAAKDALLAALRDDPHNPFLAVAVYTALQELARLTGDSEDLSANKELFSQALKSLPFDHARRFLRQMAVAHKGFRLFSENLGDVIKADSPGSPIPGSALAAIRLPEVEAAMDSYVMRIPVPASEDADGEGDMAGEGKRSDDEE